MRYTISSSRKYYTLINASMRLLFHLIGAAQVNLSWGGSTGREVVE